MLAFVQFRNLAVRNFRQFEALEIELHASINLIVGGNAAGKTSLIEAFHVLGHGRSHIGSPRDLVTSGGYRWAVEADADSSARAGPSNRVQVLWDGQRSIYQINNQGVVLADLVRFAPVLLLDPLTHRLVEEGPGIRRRFLDWGVFHMEHSFYRAWARMSRSLKQRNAALRAGASDKELEIWNRELIESSEAVTSLRVRYVEKLNEAAAFFLKMLAGESTWQVTFQRGWKEGESLIESLERNLASDRRLGHTRYGPHRAELRFVRDNVPSAERLSRGQQKLMIAALVFAQSAIYYALHGEAPLLLIDDFTSELSEKSQQTLMGAVTGYQGQTVVTALEYLGVFADSSSHRMFHVEHGNVIEVVTT